MKKVISILMITLLLVGCVAQISFAEAATTKLVAITFDDGPSGYTPTLLDGLKARGAKATFFCVADMINARPSVVKRAVAEGHQIANHTSTHPDLTTLSAAGIRAELNRCHSALVQAGGEQTYALRPPYGSYNSTVRSVTSGPIILWSVDTLDWKYRNADTVYNNIISKTTDGSIILLHDLYSSSVQGALRAIDTLQARGYEFVTVNELFRRRGITLQRGQVYTSAYNKGITLPAADAPKAPTLTTKNVLGGKQVTLSCATKNTTIYYTTDGSEPSEHSKKYTGAFTIKKSARIRAVAYNQGVKGEALNQWVTLEKSPAPIARFADGKITLTPASGTLIYYTTDSTDPTDKSPRYSGPVKVGKRLNIRVTSSGKEDRILHYTITQYGHILTDVPAGAWYYNAVGEAIERGIMKGVGEMEFAPEEKVTRAMFVTALHRMSPDYKTHYASSTFIDVSAGKWYSKAVAWAQKEGIVKGMTHTEFAPELQISREQMCVMLHRYLKAYGYQLEKTARPDFKDKKDISSWAKKDVYALYEMGLIDGMGNNNFCPKQHATRAQCAKLLVALDQRVAQN